MWFMQNAMAKPDNAGAGATDYMHLFGLVALGYMWARMAEAALALKAKGPGRGRAHGRQARDRPLLHGAEHARDGDASGPYRSGRRCDHGAAAWTRSDDSRSRSQDGAGQPDPALDRTSRQRAREATDA